MAMTPAGSTVSAPPMTEQRGTSEEPMRHERGAQIPPMQRYFTSRYSSMPYLEPSRPMPLSLTPPKGAISVEMMPSLMPTMPYSSASAARQMRPMSRL